MITNICIFFPGIAVACWYTFVGFMNWSFFWTFSVTSILIFKLIGNRTLFNTVIAFIKFAWITFILTDSFFCVLFFRTFAFNYAFTLIFPLIWLIVCNTTSCAKNKDIEVVNKTAGTEFWVKKQKKYFLKAWLGQLSYPYFIV